MKIKISNDIEYTKECIHQLENTLKDTNHNLAQVLKGNLERRGKVTYYNSNVSGSETGYRINPWRFSSKET